MFMPGGISEGFVSVVNGRIVRIEKNLRRKVDSFLDFRKAGVVVLPGLIDMHVHLRDFTLAREESILTGTRAAARGGFAVVLDMPNTKPRLNSPSLLRRRDALARRRAVVDYGFYYGTPEKMKDLTETVPMLCVGFKIYMVEEFYTEKREMVDGVLRFASRKDMPVVVHAENPEFFGSKGHERPPEAEASAIGHIVEVASKHHSRLHITHLSSSLGLSEFWTKKKSLRGRVDLSTDTCPHYLLLTVKDLLKKGAVAKVYPPLRGDEDREVLLRGLRNGRIDAVTSDHAPHLIEEKQDMETASGGFPGLETTLPLLLTLVNKKKLRLGDIVRLCSVAPSKILRIPRVGEIREGNWGNFTVVDLRRDHRINPEEFESKAKYTPFEGMLVKGAPICTIVRGRPVFLDGEIVSKGGGKNVKTYGEVG